MTTPTVIRPPLPSAQIRGGKAPPVAAAQSMAGLVAEKLRGTAAFQQLPPATQTALLRDLRAIQTALSPAPLAAPTLATAQETPADLARLRAGGVRAQDGPASSSSGGQGGEDGSNGSPGPKRAATDTLAEKTGALVDEVDFPAFVAGLVHGTFDAIVDSAIRQMESFAELVSAIARDSQSFTRDNVTANQARDWLVQHFPQDLRLNLRDPETLQPRLRVRQAEDDSETLSPGWLADFGFEGQELTDEFVEEQLVPAARQRVGDSRLQMLATMVLLGMNRIVVRDGSISAQVNIRTAARDMAKVDYAVSQDPTGGSTWGSRGSNAYVTHDTKISSVNANVQTRTDLSAKLYGEVKINFASETLPLDRFVDQARLTLLQNHSRPVASLVAGATPPPPAAPAATVAPTVP